MHNHVRPRPPWERHIPEVPSGKALPAHVVAERLREQEDPHALPGGSRQPKAPWKHVEISRRSGQALVGERVTAAQATRRPFYCETDDRGPPEYEQKVEEEQTRLRARAAKSSVTPWHSGGIYEEDGEHGAAPLCAF